MQEDFDVSSHTLLQAVVGSTAYGLAHEGSDIDRLAVFYYPTEHFFKLTPPQETFVQHEPDVTMHEVGKFVRLALKCNPTILEMLWMPEYEVDTQWGMSLRAMRHSFLSEKYVRNAFGGYAYQQAKRLQNRDKDGKKGFSSTLQNRTAKHARHCFRLLDQGQQLLETGDMRIRVTNADKLFALGMLSVPEIVQVFEERYERFQAAMSVLPEHPDTDAVESWLCDLRFRFLTNTPVAGGIPVFSRLPM